MWCSTLILNLGFDWRNGDKQVDLRTRLVFFQSITITIPCCTSFLREAVEFVVKTISMNHIYHITPLAWNAPKRNNKKKKQLKVFPFVFLNYKFQHKFNAILLWKTRRGETLSSVPCIWLFFQLLSPSIYSTCSLPSSIPLNSTILARLQSHHFSIIHWLVPLLRQGAVKELKQLNLLSYTAVNNAIRVTDCQEGAELRLLWMCVRVCLRECAFGCAFAHTPDARRMTHLKSTSPLMLTGFL